MTINELRLVIDHDLPVWSNNGCWCDRYESFSEALENVSGRTKVMYITVDGSGELTLEISRLK